MWQLSRETAPAGRSRLLGMRQGETLGLRWSYVDLETGVIRAWFQIQRTAWRHGCDNPYACGEQWHRRSLQEGMQATPAPSDLRNRLHKEGSHLLQASLSGGLDCSSRQAPEAHRSRRCLSVTQGQGEMTLQCPPPVLVLLKEHRKRQAAQRLRAGDAWKDHDLVFATRHGGPIERTEDCGAGGDPQGGWGAGCQVHDAWHMAATLLIEQGVHIRVVQEVLVTPG